jgi:hypothetical protein
MGMASSSQLPRRTSSSPLCGPKSLQRPGHYTGTGAVRRVERALPVSALEMCLAVYMIVKGSGTHSVIAPSVRHLDGEPALSAA